VAELFVGVCNKAVMTNGTDVAALWDDCTYKYNAGFITIKPTNISKHLYQLIKSITGKSAKINDQMALNTAVNFLKKNTTLKAVLLSRRQFLDGREYFEKPRRLLAFKNEEKCDHKNQSNCALVVHHNWMIGKAAKVYRFREHLMWMYDGNDQYYTSNTRLYLTYTNQAPTFIKHRRLSKYMQSVTNSEITALKTSLIIGYLLNRTVILPKFHFGPYAAESPLNSLIHIKTFDSYFAGKYRESSFLRHPKVPVDVKYGLSKLQLMSSKPSGTTLARQKYTVSETDVVRQFGKIKDKVLVFDRFHDVNVAVSNTGKLIALKKKLHQSLYRSNYRQHKRWQL